MPLPLVELSNPLELVAGWLLLLLLLVVVVEALLPFPPNPKAFNLLEILLPSIILLLKSSILVLLGNVCDNDVKLDVK